MLRDDAVGLAWVAGLLEGEGWFGVNQGAPRVSVSSIDRWVLDRLVEVSGMGRVYRLRDARPEENRRAAWIWQVYRRAEAEELMRLVRPLLCPRRGAVIDSVLDGSWVPSSSKGRPRKVVPDPA